MTYILTFIIAELFYLNFVFFFFLLGPFGAFVFSMAKPRQRGIFPFPVPGGGRLPEECKTLSRSVRRRLEAQGHVDTWVRDVVIALSCMYSGEENWGDFEGSFDPTLSQRICLAKLRQAVLDVGKPPDGITGEGALDELRTRPGYADCANLAPMDLQLLSLPSSGTVAASMEMVFGEAAEGFVQRLLSKVSAAEAVDEKKKVSELKSPYVDPLLKHNPRKYAEFCRMLEARGLVEYHASYMEQVGVFTVWKKNGKQRMVIDARMANLHFEEPEKVHLATGATFASMEVDEGPPIEVGGVDIADAFYHLQLVPELRQYFALPGVRARDVGYNGKNQKGLDEQKVIYPCLKVVPMGWTHALWVCQMAHQFVVDSNPRIDSTLRAVDRRPLPHLKEYLHTQYVDNFVAFSQKKGKARELAEDMGRCLNERGLPTHEVEDTPETLGWCFGTTSPSVGVTSKRIWKLRLATLELLKKGKCNGKTVERLVGHYTFAGLIRRSFLSVFQATYVFMRKHYEREEVIWPEVQRELRWASALLCLLHRDLGATWSTRVHATDASLWGRGIVAGERDIEEVRALGRRNDRWRFHLEEEKQVVAAEMSPWADQVDIETMTGAGDLQLGEVGTVEGVEVPLEFLEGSWTNVDGARWDRAEAIPILEGRSIVWLMQHLARSQKNLGKRHLILSDSMSATLAISKGRSSSKPMNRVCRQIAAIELITGMQIHLRWIPSELNPADFPSRAQSVKLFDLNEGLQKFLESHAASAQQEKSRGWRASAARFYRQCRRCGDECNGPGKFFGNQPPGGGLCDAGGQGEAEEESEGSSKASTSWSRSRSTSKGGQDLPGAAGREWKPRAELRQGLPCFPELEPPEEDSMRPAGGPGSCCHQHAQLHVLSRTRSSRCSDLGGSCPLLPARCEESGRPAKNSGSHEGIQKVGTGPRTSTNAMANPMCLGPQSVEQGKGSSHLVAGDLGNMCSTRRSPSAEKEGHCGTFPHEPVLGGDPQLGKAITGRGSPDVRQLPKPRDGQDIEGRRVGRSHPDRPALHERTGTSAHEVRQEQGSRGPTLRLQHARGNHALQQPRGGQGLRQGGDRVHLPDPAWKRVNRRAERSSQPHRGHEARTMASTEVSPPIHKRRPTVPGVRGLAHRDKDRSHHSREVDVRDFRCWRVERRRLAKIGLELFSGSGHFSKAMRKRVKNVFCAEVDFNHGPQFDLSDRKVQREIIDLITSGSVAYIWMGTRSRPSS